MSDDTDASGGVGGMKVRRMYVCVRVGHNPVPAPRPTMIYRIGGYRTETHPTVNMAQ
jgi:hypothetical protein